jgi:choline dehydrogenase-like flavoprotein
MACDAGHGVVDPHLRVHGSRNLYICSAAVFPTVGFSNPTHTVVALALRLADRLSNEVASRAHLDTIIS